MPEPVRAAHHEGGAPISPKPGQLCPEETISLGQLRTLNGPLQHAKLVTKSEMVRLRKIAATAPNRARNRAVGQNGRSEINSQFIKLIGVYERDNLLGA